MPSNGRQIGEQRKLASERLNYIDGLNNVASNLSKKYTQKASVGSSFAFRYYQVFWSDENNEKEAGNFPSDLNGF